MSRPGDVRLHDECSEPPLRRIIGDLMARSGDVALALARIRLGTLDLTEEEIGGPDRCRVLLGQLDAVTLLDAGPVGPGASNHTRALARLLDWLGSGRLEVRSAGIASWTPDFSVYHARAPGPSDPRVTCLLGAHYFGSPQLTVGPSFTLVTTASATAAVLARRFDEVWTRAHDVAPAIAGVLQGAGGGPGRGADGP